MKLGPIIKRDKRNTSTLKKFDDYTVSTNCDVIVFFSIYCKFAAIRKRDSGCLVYKIYIFINSNLKTEPENRTKKSLAQLLYYCLK